MQSQSLFYLAFAAQILVISVLIPRLLLARMRFVIENYPPQVYPRLYPRSMDYYDSKRTIYGWMNGVLAASGVAVLVALVVTPHHYDLDNTIALVFFLAQAVPQIWLDLSLRSELKMMRALDDRSTRTAALSPRRFFDVMSPRLFGAVGVVYIGFWLFTTWLRQFDYPWFGGYLNNAIITAMIVVFGAILMWNIYGRRLDPHQSERDRLRQLRRLALVLSLTSIAVMLFATLTIGLSAVEAKAYRPFAVSLYFQLLAVISLHAYRVDTLNFDVYRIDAKNDDAVAT